MARMVRISNTGELIVGGKTININTMLFKAPNNVNDIDGNPVLDSAVLAVTADFNNINNKLASNQNIIVDKVNKSYVDSVAAQKAGTGEVILKSDIAAIRSASPTVSGPTTCTEGDTLTYTITDYNVNNVYEIESTIGVVTYAGADTFTILVDQVNADTNGNVSVVATEPHKVKSLRTSIGVTVFDIPYNADQIVIDANFSLNFEYNDGYTF